MKTTVGKTTKTAGKTAGPAGGCVQQNQHHTFDPDKCGFRLDRGKCVYERYFLFVSVGLLCLGLAAPTTKSLTNDFDYAWATFRNLTFIVVIISLLGILSAPRRGVGSKAKLVLKTLDQAIFLVLLFWLVQSIITIIIGYIGSTLALLTICVLSAIFRGCRNNSSRVVVDFDSDCDSAIFQMVRALILFTPFGIGFVCVAMFADAFLPKSKDRFYMSSLKAGVVRTAHYERRCKLVVQMSVTKVVSMTFWSCGSLWYALWHPFSVVSFLYNHIMWAYVTCFMSDEVKFVLQSGGWYEMLKNKGTDRKTMNLMIDIVMLCVSLLKTASSFDAAGHVANFIIKRMRAGNITMSRIMGILSEIARSGDEAVSMLVHEVMKSINSTPDGHVLGGGRKQAPAEDDQMVLQFGPDWMNRFKNIGNYPRIVGLVKIASIAFAAMTLTKFDVTSVKNVLEQSNSVTGNFKDVGDLIKLFFDMSKAVYECVLGMSLDPLFSNDNPIAKWSDEVSVFTKQVKAMKTSIDGTIDGHDLSSLITKGEKLRDDYKPLLSMASSSLAPKYVTSLRIMYTVLHEAYNELIVMGMKNSQRVQPFGITLHGPSSIGKSCLVNYLHRINCALFNPDADPESKIYTYTGATKHMDGLAQDVVTFLMDDIGKENPTKTIECDSLNVLIGVGNSVAFIASMAELEAKSKTLVAPKALVLTTNTEHLNARHFLSHPVAAWRRIHYVVRMSVNSEFKMEGTERLDPSLVVEDNEDRVWTFRVIRKIFRDDNEVSYQNIPEELVFETKSLKAFLKWYRTAISDHHTREGNRLSQVKTLEMCPVCNLPKRYCDCSLVGVREDADGRRFPNDDSGRVSRGDMIEEEPVGVVLQADRPNAPPELLNDGEGDVPDHIGRILLPDLDNDWDETLFGRLSYLIGYTWGLVFYLVRAYIFMLWDVVSVLASDFLTYSWGIACRIIMARIRRRVGDELQARRDMARAILARSARTVKSKLKYVLLVVAILVALRWLYFFFKSMDLQGATEGHTLVRDEADVKSHWTNVSKVDEVFATNGAIKTTRNNELDLSGSTLRMHVQPIGYDRTETFVLNGFIYRENRVITVGHQFNRFKGADFSVHLVMNSGEALAFTLLAGEIYDASSDRHYDLVAFKAPMQHYRKDYLGTARNTYFHDDTHRSLSSVKAFIGRADNDWYVSSGLVTKFGNYAGQSSLLNSQLTQRVMPIFYGTWDEGGGYCGSPIASVGSGFTNSGYSGILGIHFAKLSPSAFSPQRSVAIRLSYEFMCHVDASLDSLATNPEVEPGYVFKTQSVNLASDHTLGPIHERCSSNWVEPYCMDGTRIRRYAGLYKEGVPIFSGRDKTKVSSTGIAKKLGPYLQETYGITSDKVGPEMQKNVVYQNIIRSFRPMCATYDRKVLWVALVVMMRDVYEKLLSRYPNGKIQDFTSLTEFEMVNGRGDALPQVNMKTSSGYPFRGPKSNVAIELAADKVPEGLSTDRKYYEFNEDVMTRYHELWRRIEEGVGLGSIYSTSLKDEPIRMEKREQGKTRPIFGSPIDKTLLTRKLFGTFIILIRSNKDAFRSAVGMNAESYDWDKLGREIDKYSEKVDGDYKHYDKNAYSYHSMSFIFDFMITICLTFGYFTHTEFRAMVALKADMLGPFIDFFGTLFMGTHSMVSGDPLTTDVNSEHNFLATTYVLLMLFHGKDRVHAVFDELKGRYQSIVDCTPDAIDHGPPPLGNEYMDLEKLAETSNNLVVRRFCALSHLVRNESSLYACLMSSVTDVFSIFYGDDNIICSNDSRVTYENISGIFRDACVEYTPAEKHLTTYFGKGTADLTFLKRRFIFDEEYNVFKAPLETEVLNKILLVKLYRNQSEPIADLEALEICWRYSCNYTREECDRWHNIIRDIVEKMDYRDNFDFSKLPSYDERMRACYSEEGSKPSEQCESAYTIDLKEILTDEHLLFSTSAI